MTKTVIVLLTVLLLLSGLAYMFGRQNTASAGDDFQKCAGAPGSQILVTGTEFSLSGNRLCRAADGTSYKEGARE
jgi:hypothetical protein